MTLAHTHALRRGLNWTYAKKFGLRHGGRPPESPVREESEKPRCVSQVEFQSVQLGGLTLDGLNETLIKTEVEDFSPDFTMPSALCPLSRNVVFQEIRNEPTANDAFTRTPKKVLTKFPMLIVW